MFKKLFTRATAFNVLSKPADQSRAPFWRKTGPTWFLSTWWPGESVDSMQYSLLSLLAIAHSERLDPGPLIDALADEHRGRYRRRLRLLARRLDANNTIVSALEKTPDALSDEVVLALRFGIQSGTLSQNFQQLIKTERPEIDEARATIRYARGYWAVVAITIVLSLGYLMTSVAPELLKISRDVEMRPPTSFLRLQAFWELVTNNLAWIVLALLAIGWLIWSSTSRRFFRHAVANQINRQPSLSKSAHLFRILSVAVEAGRPLAGSLSTLAKYHFDKNIRQRLLLARNETEQGIPAWTSMAEAKLVSRQELNALIFPSSARVQAWTLRQMSNVKSELARQRTSRCIAFLHPAVILVFAAIVLTICYSFFNVLTELIHFSSNE